MFKTILVALDGSETAKRALEVATGLARSENAKLVLAHVDELILGKGGGHLKVDESEIIAEINVQAEELQASGVDAHVEVASEMLGGPAPELADIAERTGADLIVAGTRGHSAIAGVVLGSVVQRLLHLARQPVLAVPSQERASSGNGASASEKANTAR